MDRQALAEALTKFSECADELDRIRKEVKTGAADELLQALYGDTESAHKLIGGSNARILMDAARRITHRERMVARLDDALRKANRELLDSTYLERRNLGGHYYPGLGDRTADCDYCDCWMGSCRSGGAEGVDPFGDCPENPKLRDAYDLLKQKNSNQRSEQ